jgi:hypothetical protein
MPKLRLYTRMSCSPRRRERLESKVWDALDTAKQLDPVSTSLLTIIVEAATTFDRPEAADEGRFQIDANWIYPEYLGIDKHPDYAALAARAAAWREKQFELYQSLKMSDE